MQFRTIMSFLYFYSNYNLICSVCTMGLKASKNKKDSRFHTNWDQNFVSIGIHDELQDDEVDRYNIHSPSFTFYLYVLYV